MVWCYIVHTTTLYVIIQSKFTLALSSFTDRYLSMCRCSKKKCCKRYVSVAMHAYVQVQLRLQCEYWSLVLLAFGLARTWDSKAA
jgi:hypothetical protein